MMALSANDRRALKLLAIIGPVLILYFFGGGIWSSLASESNDFKLKKARFEPLIEDMKNHSGWLREIESKQESLHVEINHGSSDEQKDAFLKKIEDLGKQNKIQITSHQWRKVSRSGRSGGIERRAFQIVFESDFPSMIRFVQGIEGMTSPVVIDEINMSKRANRNQQGKRRMRTTMQLHVYIFPETPDGPA